MLINIHFCRCWGKILTLGSSSLGHGCFAAHAVTFETATVDSILVLKLQIPEYSFNLTKSQKIFHALKKNTKKHF